MNNSIIQGGKTDPYVLVSLCYSAAPCLTDRPTDRPTNTNFAALSIPANEIPVAASTMEPPPPQQQNSASSGGGTAPSKNAVRPNYGLKFTLSGKLAVSLSYFFCIFPKIS